MITSIIFFEKLQKASFDDIGNTLLNSAKLEISRLQNGIRSWQLPKLHCQQT